MRIGTIFSGKMKTFNNQFISTKFFMFIIPLFPIESYFFINNKNEGFEIGLHKQSVIKAYASIFSLVLGSFILLMHGSFYHYKLLYQYGSIIGFFLILLSLYFFFEYGKTTEEEKKERFLYEKAIKINALPEYLNENATRRILRKLLNSLKLSMNLSEEIRDINIDEIIQKHQYNKKDLGLLFAIKGYQKRLNQSDNLNDHQIYNMIKNEFKSYLTTLKNNISLN